MKQQESELKHPNLLGDFYVLSLYILVDGTFFCVLLSKQIIVGMLRFFISKKIGR